VADHVHRPDRRLREAEEALEAERLKNNVLIEALTGRKAP